MNHEAVKSSINFSVTRGEVIRRLEKERSYPNFDALVLDYYKKKSLGIGCYTIEGKILPVKDFQPYNGSIYFKDGQLRLIGRVDKPNSEIGTARAFDPTLDPETGKPIWSVNGFKQPMEDPRLIKLGNYTAVLGTGTQSDEKDPNHVAQHWPILVLQAPDGSIERYEFTNLHGTKDMTLRTSRTNSITGEITVDILTRDRREDKNGKISCTIHKGTATIRHPSELNDAAAEIHRGLETTLNAGVPNNENNRWFGFMQLIPLVNGHMGVLGHDAVVLDRKDSDTTKPKKRIYATTIREYDENWNLVGNPQIISMAEDYPTTDAKWDHLEDVLVGMNLLYGRDKDGNIVSCTLVAGLKDKQIVLGTLSEIPFSAEPDPLQNELFIGDIRTLQHHDIPVLRTSLGLAA